ncbi:hypothetical protein E4U54_004944 [Claviceps lovelessii]|nr:hypothetical protein E4U54_004944 [Claviceps lovelessii]
MDGGGVEKTSDDDTSSPQTWFNGDARDGNGGDFGDNVAWGLTSGSISNASNANPTSRQPESKNKLHVQKQVKQGLPARSSRVQASIAGPT